jgi:hypothetical protein
MGISLIPLNSAKRLHVLRVKETLLARMSNNPSGHVAENCRALKNSHDLVA